MSALLKSHVELQSREEEHNAIKETSKSRKLTDSNLCWYSPETGIYSSKYPSINLPSEPLLDVVSFIFSHKHNGQHALVDYASGLSVPYSKLLPLVKSMATGLHHLGVKQGDVILILLPNSVCFPLIFLGVLSIGAIVTPMNPSSSLLEVKRQVLDTKATLAFAAIGKVDELVNAFGGCRVVGVPEVLDLNSQPSDGSVFHKLISSDPAMAPRPRIMQRDTAAILYSSGTTGRSKGVMLSHGNFIAMIELFVRFEASLYDYPSTENVYLAVVPMFHVYGLSLFVLGLFSLGSSIVTMKRFNADEMGRAIDRYGITHLHAVPPILLALTKIAKRAGGDSFRSLKQVSCGAAPLSEKSITELMETLPRVDFIQGYGMTESTALATRGYGMHRYMSAGLLSPNVEAKVVDWVTGAHIPPGSVGELWLRTPGNMKGYLNNIDETVIALDKDGWLHTGDIVYFDQEGYLYVIDRLKEMIKYKGFQIAPADLEAVLMSHPEVLDAAVTGGRDEEAGEIPVAFVVPRERSWVSEAALMNYVAKQVAPYKKVRRVYFCPAIPRSPAGKILRKELRNIWMLLFDALSARIRVVKIRGRSSQCEACGENSKLTEEQFRNFDYEKFTQSPLSTIAPADLEAVLMSHPEVLDAAVTGGRDEEAGEIPVAFVVPRERSWVSEAALMNYVAKQVAPYKKVRRVYFCPAIPRSPAGKILRKELRNMLVSRL